MDIHRKNCQHWCAILILDRSLLRLEIDSNRSLCLSGLDGCLLYYFCFNMVVQSPYRWWGNLDKSLHHCGASLSSGCCRSSPGGKQDLYHLKVEQEEEEEEDHVGYLLVIVGIEVLLVKIELPLVHQVEVSPVQSVAQTHVGEDAVARGEQGVRLQWTLLKDCRVHSFFSHIYIYKGQVCLTSENRISVCRQAVHV